jgi:protein gp37
LFPYPSEPGIDWVIVGGESGPHARPMQPVWAFDLKAHCETAGTAFFMKQLGSVAAKRLGLHHPHGADWREWPYEFIAALYKRQWPSARYQRAQPVEEGAR